MTEVAFHFNAPDKLTYACRFARKVLRKDLNLVITGAAADLDRLDRMLWALGPSEFLAHAHVDSDAELVDASPLLLASDPRRAHHRDVLLNLGAEMPLGFDQFDKVIEVVSASDEADRAQARTRWRQYTTAGYALVRHDLVLKEGA